MQLDIEESTVGSSVDGALVTDLAVNSAVASDVVVAVVVSAAAAAVEKKLILVGDVKS